MLAARKMLQANGFNEKVRRNLFGEVDHEQLKKDFETNMRDDLEKAKLKWNFDFKKQIPVKGKYEWVRVEDPFLKSTTQEIMEDPHQEITTQEVLEDPLQEAKTGEVQEDPLQETTTQEVLKDPLLENTTQESLEWSQQEVTTQGGDTTSYLVGCKRKQAAITDYYQVKRRCSPLPSPSQCDQ
ncbi:cyclin-dependent kinase inhibitor 1-like isoform X1 [Ranitomeya imitator]